MYVEGGQCSHKFARTRSGEGYEVGGGNGKTQIAPEVDFKKPVVN